MDYYTSRSIALDDDGEGAVHLKPGRYAGIRFADGTAHAFTVRDYGETIHTGTDIFDRLLPDAEVLVGGSVHVTAASAAGMDAVLYFRF